MAAKDVSQYQTIGPKGASDTLSDCEAVGRAAGRPSVGQWLGRPDVLSTVLMPITALISNGSAVKTAYFRPWQDCEILGAQVEKGTWHADMTSLTLDILVSKTGGTPDTSCLPSATPVATFTTQPVITPDDETTTTDEEDRGYYLRYGESACISLDPGGTGANTSEAASFQTRLFYRLR